MRLTTLVIIASIATMPTFVSAEPQSIDAQKAAKGIQDSLRSLAEMQANPNSAQARAFLNRTQGALIRNTQHIDLSAEMDAINARTKEVEKKFSILNKRDP